MKERITKHFNTTNMIDYSNKGTVWYAMKTTFKRELKAKAWLEAISIENFIPMQRTTTIVRGQKKLLTKPALHNLIFIRVDGDLLRKIKERVPYLHNYLTEQNGVLEPIIIPDREMEQFITISEASLAEVRYIDLTTTRLDKGTRVRIIGGDFEGFEGTLMKIKGARDKRVVLAIEGLMAVVMTTINTDFIEKI